MEAFPIRSTHNRVLKPERQERAFKNQANTVSERSLYPLTVTQIYSGRIFDSIDHLVKSGMRLGELFIALQKITFL